MLAAIISVPLAVISALRAGLTIFPEALGVMAGSQGVSRILYPRIGPRRLLVGGLLVPLVGHWSGPEFRAANAAVS